MAETIKSYVEKTNAAWDDAGKSVDQIQAAATGLTGDVTFLKDTIVKLQNNPGPISAEDQALLDAGVPRAEEAVRKLQGLAQSIKELDETTGEPIVEGPPPTDPGGSEGGAGGEAFRGVRR